MKKIIASAAVMLLIGAAGCTNKGKTSDTASANDISPLPPPVAYQPAAPAPAAANSTASLSASEVTTTPMAADMTTTTTTTNYKSSSKSTKSGSKAIASTAGGKKYVVQKGDSLFKIAKKEYGKGGDYKKILAANPGLNPDKLQAGKTIIIP